MKPVNKSCKTILSKQAMMAFFDSTFVGEYEDSTERIKELQHAIHETTRKLEEVQQQRVRVNEEMTQCIKETQQRMELMNENSEAVEMLQQLGHMLQKEKHLSEQLNGHVYVDRNQSNDLQERCERFTTQVRHLTDEILEVKRRLTEVTNQTTAVQALIRASASKKSQPARKKSKQTQVTH